MLGIGRGQFGLSICQLSEETGDVNRRRGVVHEWGKTFGSIANHLSELGIFDQVFEEFVRGVCGGDFEAFDWEDISCRGGRRTFFCGSSRRGGGSILEDQFVEVTITVGGEKDVGGYFVHRDINGCWKR
jgi:hypothetical protein